MIKPSPLFSPLSYPQALSRQFFESYATRKREKKKTQRGSTLMSSRTLSSSAPLCGCIISKWIDLGACVEERIYHLSRSWLFMRALNSAHVRTRARFVAHSRLNVCAPPPIMLLFWCSDSHIIHVMIPSIVNSVCGGTLLPVLPLPPGGAASAGPALMR